MSGSVQRARNAEIDLKRIKDKVDPEGEEPIIIKMWDFTVEGDTREKRKAREDELNSHPWSNKYRIELTNITAEDIAEYEEKIKAK